MPWKLDTREECDSIISEDSGDPLIAAYLYVIATITNTTYVDYPSGHSGLSI